MKIQRFASIYDDMIAGYNQSINDANQRMNEQVQERDKLLADYNTQYQNQLNEYQVLQDQQQANIDNWAETQREQQQKQTDYEIGLINQNKAEAEKQTKTEQANAYIDYQKGLNEFGGSSEQLASQGLQGTGFAKNQDIAMNITYQNRVASANTALQKANTDYNNQIQQALLSNDANLAALAYQEMQQQYQLALQGFEYRTSMLNQKLDYETSTRNTYYNRINDYLNKIETYKNNINSVQQAKYESQQSRSYGGGSYSSGGSSGGTSYTDTSSTPTYYNQYYGQNIAYNTDALSNGKLDKSKVFSNGYQPNNVGGKKLSSSGMKVSDVFGTGNVGRTGVNIDNQKIWSAGGKYYIWDGSQNSYVDVTSDVKSYKSSGKQKTSGGKGGRKF